MARRPFHKLGTYAQRAERALLSRTWPPRLLQVGLGAWLVLTVFLWPHSRVQATLALGAGALTVLLSLVAVWFPPIRLLLALVGVWLFIGTVVQPSVVATLANNVAVAVLTVLLSLAPRGETKLLRRKRPVPQT